MTLAGVAVGVAALLALLSYGAGLQRIARAEFDALALYNTLRVTSTPTPISGFGDLTVRTTDANARVDEVALTDSILAVLNAVPGVVAAYPEITFSAGASSVTPAAIGNTTTGKRTCEPNRSTIQPDRNDTAIVAPA